jgi:hypothetical protein
VWSLLVVRARLRPDAARVCPEQDKNKSHFSKESENRRNKFQAKKLTEVAGRINSSKVQRTHFNPRSWVLHAATFSSSSASSPDLEVAAHGVQAISRVWVTLLDVLVSSSIS